MRESAPFGLRVLLLVGSVFSGLLHSSPAAEIYTETFDSGLNGWSNTDDYIWVPTNGQLAVTLPAAGGGALPSLDTAVLETQSNPFTFSYRAVHAAYIGLDFVYDLEPPSNLELYLARGPNESISVNLTNSLGSAGTTNRILVSLESPAAGGWFPTNNVNFENTLTGVTLVRLTLQADPADEQLTYRIDNIFLVGPAESGGAVVLDSEAGATTTWNTQRQFSYQLEAAEDLRLGEPGWSAVSGAIFSSSDILEVVDPAATNAAVRMYRLRLLE